MDRKNKFIILSLGPLIFIVLISALIYELQYINKVEFLSPIDFEGELLVRSDPSGNGEFGSQRNGKRMHNGLDILAKIGTPVKATRSGRVINAQIERGLGKYVEIKHRGGFISIYAHLSKINVNKGQRVRQGQIIGEVGKTGNAIYKNIRPHLHFEIRKDDKPLNPKEYLFELDKSDQQR